jgi:hypothetical protein
VGLKKYGIPSNSAAVHGFRYNARVLAGHVAQKHFDVARTRRPIEPEALLDRLLEEATSAPELWNQQSYLARVITFEEESGINDDGIVPLAHFVDSTGPDAVALTVETDPDGDIHPALYLRRDGHVSDHTLPSDPLLDFRTAEHRSQLKGLLGDLLE